MHARSLKAVAAAAVAVATTALLPAPAEAATAYYMYGYAAGSVIRDASRAVTSQLSAPSEVSTAKAGVQDTNTVEAVNAQGVLSLGTVNTSAKTSAIPGGRQVSVTAHSRDVNVLNGLITADTISTTTTTKRVNGILTTTTQSAYTNLHIGSNMLPLTIPKNMTVKVPDIATVEVNVGITFDSYGTGVGLRVTLLKPKGTAGTGAEIDVNPTFTSITPSGPTTGHSTLGSAYATKITSAGGSAVTVPTRVLSQGTGGQTLTNSAAAVNTPVGSGGPAQTTGVGTNTTTVASVTMTASVANLNLLNGLITAQSLKVTAHADLSQTTGAMTVVDLQIGGTTIPLNVKPNTVMNLDIGKVTINQRIRSGQSISVRAIDIVLAKATNGLPVGAEIQVAPATAAVS